jgi:hypothetical protein
VGRAIAIAIDASYNITIISDRVPRLAILYLLLFYCNSTYSYSLYIYKEADVTNLIPLETANTNVECTFLIPVCPTLFTKSALLPHTSLGLI